MIQLPREALRMPDTLGGTTFIFGEEAVALAAAAPAAGRVVTFTPAARAQLESRGAKVLSSAQVYTDRGHARATVRMARALGAVERMAGDRGIDSAAAELLVFRAAEVAALAGALWEVLRLPGPWLICENAAWCAFERRTEAHAALVRAALRETLMLERKPFIAPAPRLARLLFSTATWLARSRGLVVLQAMRRDLDRLAADLETVEGVDVATPGLWSGPWKEFVRGALDLVQGVRNGSRLIPPLRSDVATRSQVVDLLSAYRDDAVVARGFAIFGETIAESCAQAAALASDLAPALARLKTRSLMVWDTFGIVHVAYSHAARRAGCRVFVAGHAAVSIPDGAISAPATDIRSRRMAASRVADVIVVQSPTVAATATRLAPKVPQIRTAPFLWGRQPERIVTPVGEPALLLWAGNFRQWTSHAPWVEETADEMIDGLIRIADAVAKSPSVALEVRIKPNWRDKGEIDGAALDAYLPKHPRIVVRSEGSFSESLGRATALITHASTAIEEAFRAKVPVVLWGARGRVHFIPGRPSPPTLADRAAVYAPRWNGDLAGYLTSVAAAHRNRPLTEDELKGLVWDGDVAGMSDLAHLLANPSDIRVGDRNQGVAGAFVEPGSAPRGILARTSSRHD